MTELVTDCPRCGSRKITFDVTQANIIGIQYGWQQWYEAFCTCRHCRKATIFVLSESANGNYEHVHEKGLLNINSAINKYVDIESFVNLKDIAAAQPPEHLPENVKNIFLEGAKCLAINCNNAAGTMFRLCIDTITRGMLPEGDTDGLNARIRRDLGLRLPWMLDHKVLPESLRELSACVREDGNDGAHAGTLKAEDAQDLLDFTNLLLERIYTEPERLRLAKVRREKRRDA
ncbi:MAG: DUF4145 domain-containing protein [Syntrophales bacterium]